MIRACTRALSIASISAGALVAIGAQAQPQSQPPAIKVDRTPDFVLVTKTCVRVASKLGGKLAPLHIDHPKRERESCWRTGADVLCNAGGSAITLRINRESGPSWFATAEGGLMMLSLDWSSARFANGITYFDDEVGIAQIQCTGVVLSGEAAARAAATTTRGRGQAKAKSGRAD
jgi:hypothetical protein